MTSLLLQPPKDQNGELRAKRNSPDQSHDTERRAVPVNIPPDTANVARTNYSTGSYYVRGLITILYPRGPSVYLAWQDSWLHAARRFHAN